MPYKTRARWCVTGDWKRRVQESDPEASYLLAPAGALVPDSVAERYGLQEAEDALFAERAQAAASDHDAGVPLGAEVQSRSTPPAHKMVIPRARKRG